jgi:hypothetical protein
MKRYKQIMFDNARWDGFELRPDDIIISTPAKCGTTWTQMICALLIFQTTTFDRPLDVISPWMDMMTRSRDDIVTDLDAQTHRRFIKSHTPYDGLPHHTDVTYICVGRDPRDVFMSWDNHVSNMDIVAVITARQNAVGLDDITEIPPMPPELEIDRFKAWLDAPVTDENGMTEIGLGLNMHHLATFWDERDDPNIVLLHYADLAADLEGEMRKLAARLGIEVPEELWPELVAAASFENMREHADVIAPETTSAIWQENRRFFNKGTSGQWQQLLGDAELELYFERVNELGRPGLVAWVHRD